MNTCSLVPAIAIAASALTAAQTIDVSRYRMVDLSHAYGPNTLYWPTSASKFALSRDASGQTLAKARAFTFVCVVTLGIGMAPIIAIHSGSRMFTTPPPGVNTEASTQLVEVDTTRVGRPARCAASVQPMVTMRST
jgi:hypothetical protein